MKKFLNTLAAALLAFSAGVAFAASGSSGLAYSPPTQNTNGTAIVPADIQGYTARCVFTPTGSTTTSPCASFTGSDVGPVSSMQVTFTIPAGGGKACFTLATKAYNITGPYSAIRDPEGCKVFDALVPNPPGNVTVVVSVQLQTGQLR